MPWASESWVIDLANWWPKCTVAKVIIQTPLTNRPDSLDGAINACRRAQFLPRAYNYF